MKEVSIYLAGACKGQPDLGSWWREKVEEYFKEYNEFFPSPHVKPLNPLAYFERDGTNAVSSKQVKNFYLKYLIKNSDLILVNLNNTQNSVGTGQELQYAVDLDIPIVGFGNIDIYEWLVDDCDVVFETMAEALTYIIEFYC